MQTAWGSSPGRFACQPLVAQPSGSTCCCVLGVTRGATLNGMYSDSIAIYTRARGRQWSRSGTKDNVGPIRHLSHLESGDGVADGRRGSCGTFAECSESYDARGAVPTDGLVVPRAGAASVCPQ